jgi:hypothetical protein
MKSRWVIHQGVRIFISDFSNFGTDAAAMQQEAEEIIEAVQKEEPASILSLALVEGTSANEHTMRVLQNLVPITNKYVKARCIVGLHGFRRHLISAFARITGRRQFVIFNTTEEALDHLAALARSK